MSSRLGNLGSRDRAQLGWAPITGLLPAASVATWLTGWSLPAPASLGVVLVALGIVALADAEPRWVAR